LVNSREELKLIEAIETSQAVRSGGRGYIVGEQDFGRRYKDRNTALACIIEV
jgi:hypothetical protein